MGLEPDGRALEPAGRALEPAGKALEPAAGPLPKNTVGGQQCHAVFDQFAAQKKFFTSL